MNNDEILNIPQPDPAWEYCEIWLELQNQCKKIDQALSFLAAQKDGSESIDMEMVKMLEPITKSLDGIIEQLIDYSQEV